MRVRQGADAESDVMKFVGPPLTLLRQLPLMRFLPLICSLLVPCCLTAQTSSNSIAPRADQVLRDACRYLAETPYYSLTAEVWREHVGESGEKLQFTRAVEMEIKRPNRLH